jgi:hypothetical protein
MAAEPETEGVDATHVDPVEGLEGPEFSPSGPFHEGDLGRFRSGVALLHHGPGRQKNGHFHGRSIWY